MSGAKTSGDASRNEMPYPTPAVDWETRAYWEGAGRGELVLQRCRACGVVQHRPRGLCVSCLTDSPEHFVASGRGEIYTFSVVRQNAMPGFRDHLPYVVAYVTLEEGPQILTHIIGCPPDEVRIGMAVEVDFEPVGAQPGGHQPDGHQPEGQGFGIPRFRPA